MMAAPIGPVPAMDLSQLAQLYRTQVIGNSAAADDAARVTGAGALARGKDFGQVIGNAVGEVENLDRTAAGKAVQAATGDLSDIHDYVIAATEAQTATELTTAVRNKMLEAFNEVMRMPL